MRKIVPGVFIENIYPSLYLGAIVSDDGLLLIDCPIWEEDIRIWLDTVSQYGQPRYMALMDSHPDRVLGARLIDIPLIAQDATRKQISTWSDTYKGNAHPIGSEADSFKRITGISHAIPDLTFSTKMKLYIQELDIEFEHHPGPTPGSMWVLIPKMGVAFIGDAVSTSTPPFMGEAEIENWLSALDELRNHRMMGYTLVSARDGVIDRQAINIAARFLRKVRDRLKKMKSTDEPERKIEAISKELLGNFKLTTSQQERALTRLHVGLSQLYCRLYGVDLQPWCRDK